MLTRDEALAVPVNVLSRDSVLEAKPKKQGSVRVPAWKGSVGLRTLTLEEIMDWGARTDRAGQTLFLVRASAVDGEGKRLFTEEDEPWLSQHPLAVMDIARAAMRHNGLDADSQELAAGN